MSISDDFLRIGLDKIIVNRDARQRKKIEAGTLTESVRKHGVIQPIVVTRDLVLIAGERRLVASREAGLPDIPVRFADMLSETERQIIELEENVKRSDLEWQDLVKAVGRIHALHLDIDPDWTMGETAEVCSISIGTVSLYLKVDGELKDNERVQKAGTVREAYNLLTRRDARAAGDALQELLETPDFIPEPPGPTREEAEAEAKAAEEVFLATGRLPEPKPKSWPAPFSLQVPLAPTAKETIICANFLEWAPKYTGPKFNLVHCDFPYGVDVFAGPQGRGAEMGYLEESGDHSPVGDARKWKVGYEDSDSIYWNLIEAFCANLDRFMSISAHLMFWCSASSVRTARTIEMFNKLAPSLAFSRFPLIWHKTDNAGIASDPRHGPRHIYETCLFASRGKRQIVRVVSDCYASPTDKKLHVSTKPEPMLRHFMTMLVDEHTVMLDPTCGSGAAIRAAESLGAKFTLGLEIDRRYAETAQQALHNFRLLKRGADRIAHRGEV